MLEHRAAHNKATYSGGETCACGLRQQLLTVLAGVDNAAVQQDHEAVEEVEAVGGGVVDGRANGDACLGQALHHCHHLHNSTHMSAKSPSQ